MVSVEARSDPELVDLDPSTAISDPEIISRMAEFGKASMRLAATDILSVTVQVIGEGGENNLHAHRGSDALWLTLSGSARFYGEHDKVLADVLPMHGLIIPRGFRYWFESSSKESLVILRIAAQDTTTTDERIDLTPQKREINHVSV